MSAPEMKTCQISAKIHTWEIINIIDKSCILETTPTDRWMNKQTVVKSSNGKEECSFYWQSPQQERISKVFSIKAKTKTKNKRKIILLPHTHMLLDSTHRNLKERKRRQRQEEKLPGVQEGEGPELPRLWSGVFWIILAIMSHRCLASSMK